MELWDLAIGFIAGIIVLYIFVVLPLDKENALNKQQLNDKIEALETCNSDVERYRMDLSSANSQFQISQNNLLTAQRQYLDLQTQFNNYQKACNELTEKVRQQEPTLAERVISIGSNIVGIIADMRSIFFH